MFPRPAPDGPGPDGPGLRRPRPATTPGRPIRRVASVDVPDTFRDLAAAPRRSRMEARGLAAAGRAEPPDVDAFKARELGALTGTVVEIGPGPGVNLRRYGAGLERLLAVEPNPVMHDQLWREAVAHGIDLEVHTVHGEVMDVPDDTADAVVGTLVLCGVDDPDRVLDEVVRVLKPGGRYVFYEHVAAPAGTVTAFGQRLLRAPHRWLFNGCVTDRDTIPLIEARFDDVHVQPSDGGVAAAHTRSRVLGTATAPGAATPPGTAPAPTA